MITLKKVCSSADNGTIHIEGYCIEHVALPLNKQDIEIEGDWIT